MRDPPKRSKNKHVCHHFGNRANGPVESQHRVRWMGGCHRLLLPFVVSVRIPCAGVQAQCMRGKPMHGCLRTHLHLSTQLWCLDDQVKSASHRPQSLLAVCSRHPQASPAFQSLPDASQRPPGRLPASKPPAPLSQTAFLSQPPGLPEIAFASAHSRGARHFLQSLAQEIRRPHFKGPPPQPLGSSMHQQCLPGAPVASGRHFAAFHLKVGFTPESFQTYQAMKPCQTPSHWISRRFPEVRRRRS